MKIKAHYVVKIWNNSCIHADRQHIIHFVAETVSHLTLEAHLIHVSVCGNNV